MPWSPLSETSPLRDFFSSITSFVGFRNSGRPTALASSGVARGRAATPTHPSPARVPRAHHPGPVKRQRWSWEAEGHREPQRKLGRPLQFSSSPRPPPLQRVDQQGNAHPIVIDLSSPPQSPTPSPTAHGGSAQHMHGTGRTSEQLPQVQTASASNHSHFNATTEHGSPKPALKQMLAQLDAGRMINDEIVNNWAQYVLHKCGGSSHRLGGADQRSHSDVTPASSVGNNRAASRQQSITPANNDSTPHGVVILSTFFFPALSRNWQGRAGRFCYERARVWAKQIIARKFRGIRRILVPIHVPHKIHWILASICLPGYRCAKDRTQKVRHCYSYIPAVLGSVPSCTRANLVFFVHVVSFARRGRALRYTTHCAAARAIKHMVTFSVFCVNFSWL